MDIYINYIKDHVLLQFLVLLSISFVIFILAKNLLLKSLKQIFKRTSTQVDDQLVAQGFFTRLSYLIPLAIIHNFAYQLPPYEAWVSRGTLAGMAVAILLALNALLNSINEIYSQSKYAQKMNIKSYFQILKLILNILGTIVVIAIVSGRSPIYLLSGIGALTAVLMLVFKDTILSFVASIQINSNDLFKIGDWLEVPQLGADGDVIDIALHTVKIQNWDKTISIIPTYKLIDSSFKNWRGMSESGGRRIKRSLYLDQNSINFCSPEQLEHLKTFELLTGYLNDKIAEVNASNSANNINMDAQVNGRRLTNIGTFRAYIQAYLKNHSKIHNELTFLIRQLSPSERGLPIEIYVFTNVTDWIEYEGIQADIFDHLLSVVPKFGLRIFQNPTGKDFKKIVS
jgi:miniconductance mechanosensitive channel